MNNKINNKKRKTLTDKQIRQIVKKSKHLGTFFDDYFEERMRKDEELRILYKKEEFLDKISETVISLRKKEGLTQKEVAEKIGLKASAIARLESSKNTRIPSYDFLTKIFKLFGRGVELSFPLLKENKKNYA